MDNNMNQNFNGQQNTGPANFTDQQYGGPSNFTQQGYNNAQNINNNQAQQNNNGPKKSSELGKWAFLFSILGCTSFIGLILAIIDITRKDGKRKDFSIAALCVCGIIFFVFAFGKIKNSRNDHGEEKVRSEHVNKVEETTESGEVDNNIENDTEAEVVEEITDDYVLSYERKSNMSDKFNSETNEKYTLNGYEFEVPENFADNSKKYLESDKLETSMMFSVAERSGEQVRFQVLIDSQGSSTYENRQNDVKDIAENLDFISYETNDIVSSGYNAVEVSGRFKSEEKDITYIGDGYFVIMYDDENDKCIVTALRETMDTNFDYIEDVKKINDSFVKADNASSVGSDFKEVMDEYEAFMDEYIEFMQTYNQNPTDAELMSQYMDVMAEYSSYSVKIASLKNDELTDEELAYYIEVTNRVSQKLLNAGLSN